MPNIFLLGFFSIAISFFIFWLYWTLGVKFSRGQVRIITFTGPSGAGKTTVVGELLKRHSEWKMIVSLTSRGSRDSDLPGEYRCNISWKEFCRHDLNGDFIWRVRAHGNMYGTLLADVRKACYSDGLSLMQILPESVTKLRIYASNKVFSIFILPPNEEELRRRLVKRGESSESIEKRITDCKKWEEEARVSGIPYEFVRNDGTVAGIVGQIESIIQKKI